MQVKSITTFTGREVDPLDIRFDDIDIRDIAHALALCNRFAGHTRWPISVAQHSVGVSFLSGSNREHQLQGLLHDAAEAYLGDVTKWLKDSPEMAAYRAAEDAALSTIMYKFGLPSELHSIVNAADRMAIFLSCSANRKHCEIRYRSTSCELSQRGCLRQRVAERRQKVAPGERAQRA